MKRLFAIVTCVLLACSTAFAAEPDLTDCSISNGSVAAVKHVDLVAPYSGTLGVFDVEAGDLVMSGDSLFNLLTTTLYATEDAKVKAVYADVGDDATAISARYGGIIAMQPDVRFQMTASILQGYNTAKNRFVNIGETLYLRSDRTGNEKGHCVVVGVSGTDFVADVLDGDFVVGESMTLYREDDYETRDNVGKGVVARRNPLLAAGQGRVAEMLVAVGDEVTAGTPLARLMNADADVGASPVVTTPETGIVGSVAVSPGQQVWKGQFLARVYLVGEIEVVAQVDEIDLDNLWVGDRVYVVLDTDPDWIITGEVTEINQLGKAQQNAAYYTVHISIPEKDVMLGASASVYIPKGR